MNISYTDWFISPWPCIICLLLSDTGERVNEYLNLQICNCCCFYLLSHVWFFVTPWTIASQAPLSIRFPRQETGVDCQFLSQGILPTQELNPSLCRQSFYCWANREALMIPIAVVPSLSHVWRFMTPWIAGLLASLSFTISQSWFKVMSNELVMPSNHLLCCPLFLSSIFLSIRVFSNESILHIRWPKYWRFSFTISPSHEYPGLISFRIGLVWPPCCPKDSQKSSPAPQFKNINSLVHSFLYGPTLISEHDYWKNNSFDKTDICQQRHLYFLIRCLDSS